MTITEANAVNEIAREVLKLAEGGVAVTPGLEHGIAILLINGNKMLRAGYTPESFLRLVGVMRGRAAKAAAA